MRLSNLDRVCLILAALDIRESDLKQLLDELTSLDPGFILHRVASIRRGLANTSDQIALAEEIEQPRRFDSRLPSREKIAARIETLLRKEAGLSVEQASQLLFGAFPEAQAAVTLNPGKLGFRRWLLRLLNVIPEAQVLQFLETYLGRRRSGVEFDWSIGLDKK